MGIIKKDNKTVPGTYQEISDHVAKLKTILFTVNARGGSGFLHSLLDNDPQILTIPQFATIWDYCTGSDLPSPETIAARFYRRNIEFFESRLLEMERFHELGENGDQSVIVCRKTFTNHFVNLLEAGPTNEGRVFRCAHAAYALTIGQDPMSAKVIFYHQHNVESLTQVICPIDENYSRLHITRDPRIGLVRYTESLKSKKIVWGFSGANYFTDDEYASASRLFANIRTVIEQVQIYQTCENEVLIITLEDLHAKQDKLLRPLLEHFSLEFSETNLQSTFWGLLWHADQRSDGRIRGFKNQAENIDLSIGLSKLDRLLMDYLMTPRLTSQGYKSSIPGGALITFALAPLMFCLAFLPTRYEFKFLMYQFRKFNLPSILRHLIFLVLRIRLYHRFIFIRLSGSLFLPKVLRG